ncbi:cation transporter [uncultured Cetobacterium sp.]|uniref:cation transporter n=1 Tax=uncultured Cetobacterium sp. TaxID=527638 RepID=UPI00260CFD63|nr:cation transporter [uncultured Cetobacterium sp.]
MRIEKEKTIMKISLYAGIIFVISEIFMSIYSKSQAVLMDAVFDSIELFIIALSIALIPLFYKPVSEKRPFGYAQYESFFIILKGLMYTSVALGLIITNIQLLIEGGKKIDYSQVVWFELVCTVTSLGIYLYMNYKNKNINSRIVDSEIYGWKIDMLYSLGMTLAFSFELFLKNVLSENIGKYMDPIVALLIALFLLPEPIKMVIRELKCVFLISAEESILKEIKEISSEIFKKYPYEVTFYDVVRTGRKVWISLYFLSKNRNIDVNEISLIHLELKNSLKDKIPDFYLEFIPDI